MSEANVGSPFGDEQVAEVPLKSAPLVRVLSQIRFPRLAALATSEDIANAFAAAMAAEYPILTEQREVAVTITPEGVTQSPGGTRVWQLRSADEAWQVSFADSFLAVDTSAYTSREDFRDRVVDVWRRFVEVVAPPFVERVGVRYVNRVDDPATLADLAALVRPEALGGATLAFDGGVQLSHSMHEALYHFDEFNGLQARWGILPPGAVLDPTLHPVQTVSWVLDLDAFRLGRGGAAAEELAGPVEQLAERAYRYFRWVVTPTFLERFGGESQ